MPELPDQPETPRPVEEKQCRICLDGPDDTLGRLIRPCLCKGSMTVGNASISGVVDPHLYCVV
jgi:hypothetical protein